MKITTYDSGAGKFDRFTVVIEIGMLVDFYAMSENPANEGLNGYLGSNAEKFGSQGRRLKKGKHLGEVIEYGALPDAVKAAILERLKGY